MKSRFIITDPGSLSLFEGKNQETSVGTMPYNKG